MLSLAIVDKGGTGTAGVDGFIAIDGSGESR
jgi:hypothetical protein